MLELFEIKEKLVSDYRRLWINKHKFEINDNEVDSNDCLSKMEYIFEMLLFITGQSKKDIEDLLAASINYIIDLDPQEKPENWDLDKFDVVETQEDIYYADLATILEDWETTKFKLRRDGFKFENGDNGKTVWVIIPKGTIMKYLGPDCNGWPEFEIRMKTQDYTLSFAGDGFKVKII